jgi:hypothetical protein
LPQPELTQFIQYFEAQQYSNQTIKRYWYAIIHFNEWMLSRNFNAIDANLINKNEFIQHRMDESSANGLTLTNNNTYSAALAH